MRFVHNKLKKRLNSTTEALTVSQHDDLMKLHESAGSSNKNDCVPMGETRSSEIGSEV